MLDDLLKTDQFFISLTIYLCIVFGISILICHIGNKMNKYFTLMQFMCLFCLHCKITHLMNQQMFIAIDKTLNKNSVKAIVSGVSTI